MNILTQILPALIFTMLFAFPQITYAANPPKPLDVKQVTEAAESGNPVEQVRLANAYHWGDRGLPKDEAKSLKWLNKAADQGNADAEYILGVVYFKGNSAASQDFIESYKWLTLMITQKTPAALKRHKAAENLKGVLEKKMKKEDILKAKKNADEWVKNHQYLPKELLP